MFIIEGPDATGKTTLAHKLGGQYFHCSYDPSWNIEAYHRLIAHTAGKLEQTANVPVVIDRLCLSEAVYGERFRDGPSYDTAALMQEIIAAYKPTLILCTADPNERYNAIKRAEMFDTVEGLADLYAKHVGTGNYGKWWTYDYCKQSADEFIKTINGDNNEHNRS